MAKQRTTLRAADLVNGALVYSPATGKTYRLGPPKKINVNRNVVNHCQLHYQNGKLAGPGKWVNLSNLRKLGFKYVGTPKAAEPWRAVFGSQEEYDASAADVCRRIESGEIKPRQVELNSLHRCPLCDESPYGMCPHHAPPAENAAGAASPVVESQQEGRGDE